MIYISFTGFPVLSMYGGDSVAGWKACCLWQGYLGNGRGIRNRTGWQ